MNTSTSPLAYDWISRRRYWLSCAVSPVFLAAGVAFLFMEQVGWRLAGGVIIVLGLLMLVRKKTTFDKSRGLWCVAHRFLGLFPVWQRTFLFDQFDAVVVERRETYHPSWPRAESEDYDILYRVGLRRKLGRPCWVHDDSFRCGQPYQRVYEFAQRLSRDSGLEIIEVEA